MNYQKRWKRATARGGVEHYTAEVISNHRDKLKKTFKYFEEVGERVQAKMLASMHIFGKQQVSQAKRRLALQKHGKFYVNKSGQLYQASAKGEPPANRDRVLRENIEYKIYTGHILTVQLGYFLSNAPPRGFNYGNYLEYHMNRPNLRLVMPYMSTYGHKTIQKLLRNAMDLRGMML